MYEGPQNVAAIFIETVTGTNGILPPPPGYLKGLRELTRKHGILLVCDEVMCGFGRTGKMFVCEHFDVVPDMLVIGKGLGGGVFPLAALLVNERLDVVGDRALGHYTHEKSSVGCAAALATLDCLFEDGLIENASRLGHHALERARAIQAEHPLVADVRGLGLHIGIELGRNGEPASDEADAVLYHSLSNDLSYKVGGGSVLTLCPPLTIDREELDRALDIVTAGIASVT